MHSSYLLALIAAALPIIIHLLLRMRKKEITFGSLMFIQKILKQKKTTLRLRELLLLFLRTLVLVLLVLAFARPVTIDAKNNQNAPESVVYVLDDTLSMSAQNLGRSNFELAKSKIINDARSLTEGSEFAIVLMSTPDRLALNFTKDIKALLRKLRSTNCTQRHERLMPAIAFALASLKSKPAVCNIALVTDAQNTSWTKDDLNSIKPDGVGIKNLFTDAKLSLPNVAIINVVQPNSNIIEVTLANYQNAAAEGLRLELYLDGSKEPLAHSLVSLLANSQKTITMQSSFAVAGQFPAYVQLLPKDALDADNKLPFVISNTAGRVALIIQDEMLTKDSRYKDTSYFLSCALNPNGQDNSPWRGVVVPRLQLNVANINSADAIFLLTSKELPSGLRSEITKYLKRGGVLIYAPPVDGTNIPAAPKRMRQKKRGHPIYAPFQKANVSGPESSRFKSWRVLSPSSQSKVIAVIGGNPALTETEVGLGKRFELAFDFTTKHSDFPKQTSFAPFVHSILKYATASKEQSKICSIELGDEFSLSEPQDINQSGVYRLGQASFLVCRYSPLESDLNGALPETFFVPPQIKETPRAAKGEARYKPSKIWAVLIAAVIAIIFVESLLINRSNDERKA